MKAIVIHSFGASNQLRLEELPRPSVGPDDVLVKIHNAGVNPIDWKIREGYMKETLRASFPFTIGQDFSGVVVDAGSSVDDMHEGAEVYGVARGAYAEYASIPRSRLALKPSSIDFIVAAAVPTAGLTAWQLVIETSEIRSDQLVLIHGAAGGVGSFVTQLARSRGARVVANASAKDRDYLLSLGVDRVIDYHSERFEDHVRDVDVAIDLVGRDTLFRTYDLVKPGGLLVSTVGPIDPIECRRRGIRGVRFVMKPNGTELAELAKLIDGGVLKPRVAQVLPLSDARKAMDLTQSGYVHGKIVLRVG